MTTKARIIYCSCGWKGENACPDCHKPRRLPRVFITVEGGLISGIAASKDVEIRVVDWDNLEAEAHADDSDLDTMDPDSPNEFLCASVDRGEAAVDRYIQEAREHLRKLKKETGA